MDCEPDRRRVRVGRARVDAIRLSQVAPALMRLLSQARERGRPALVVTPNIQHIALLENGGCFQDAYRHADLVLPDGWPVALLTAVGARTACERVTGSDLLPTLCRRLADGSASVALVGGAPGSATIAAQIMRSANPGLRVCCTHEAPLGIERDAEAMNELRRLIRESRPDFLFLGMGAPKQECFAMANLMDLPIGVVLCVGASIDFVSGNQTRAPRWLRRVGLEWLYRILREPKRLWRRYAVAVPLFVRAAIRGGIGTGDR